MEAKACRLSIPPDDSYNSLEYGVFILKCSLNLGTGCQFMHGVLVYGTPLQPVLFSIGLR